MDIFVIIVWKNLFIDLWGILQYLIMIEHLQKHIHGIKTHSKKGFSSRASGMTIKGDYKKYNKKVFEKEVKRFVKWVKKAEPWNVVDYAKFGGYK